MDSKQKAGSKIKWVADRISEKFFSNPPGNVIQYDIVENEKSDFIPSYRDQLDILRKMEKRGVIAILNGNKFKKYLSENPSGTKPTIVVIDIQKEKFEAFYAEYEKYKFDKEPVEIKSIKLDERNYQLNINRGQKIISFSSKRKLEGLEKEVKLFKILAHLWEFRREIKRGKMITGGNFEPIENLQKTSGSKSIGATKKAVSRLNSLFEEENMPIKIDSPRYKYRLAIELS